MDFFARQENARRKTTMLVVYFIAAVVLITLAVNAIVYFLFGASGFMRTGLSVVTHSNLGEWMGAPHWIWTSIVIVGLIGLGSLFSYLRLRGGGRSVARMMDARLVDLNTRDPREQRLINVVEEMSIASGTPVPELYIQDGELGINAFVAGYQIREAVLVVTEGALANLTRDELQGVVGHEFSHILNGDMRINVRLIAVLAGIVLLSQAGGYMMRSTRRSRLGRGSSKNALGMGGLGIALFLLGYIGLFFGRLIKAAISRQREYLADAASVQFTRNPDGLAGALYKIQTHSGGSHLMHAHAEDMSHMCFGETTKMSFTSLFATHPPLADRIKAVHPRFIPAKTQANDDSLEIEITDEKAEDKNKQAANVMGAIVTAGVLVESVGNPSPAHVEYARKIHSEFSPEVIDCIHQPLGARACIYALVLTKATEAEYEKAENIVKASDGAETASMMREVLADVRKLGVSSRLPLVELTFPALGRLHRDQKEAFVRTLEQVIKVDNKFTLLEFALMTVIRKHLMINPGAIVSEEYTSLEEVKEQVQILVSLFSKIGASGHTNRASLYSRAMAIFGPDFQTTELKSASVEQLTDCLNHLDRLSPLLKRPVINACADCVLADGNVRPIELELLRATCAALDCPMPPLLTTQAA